MITPVFGIYDRKSKYFKTVFHARSKGEAVRSFTSAINTSDHSEISDYPEDFDLMEVAEYDDKTAQYTNRKIPESMGNGSDYKKISKQMVLPGTENKEKKQ